MGTPPEVKQIASSGEAAIYIRSETLITGGAIYTKDSASIIEIGRQVEQRLASLQATVENLFAKQTIKNGEAQGLNYDQILEKYDGKLKEFYQNLQVDNDTQLKAQQEISANGFWGVSQTSQRLIKFAQSLTGGDTSKIALIRNSIEEGYKAAEKSWGGSLPDISSQTLAATLKGLDEWAAQVGQSA